MKIALLSRSLETGGAERQLVNLALGLQQEKDVEVTVLVFYDDGALQKELCDADVPIVSLYKRARWDPFFVARIVAEIRGRNYDILHSFLDGPNVLVALLRPLLKQTRVVWSVRSSYVDWSRYNWLARVVYRFSRLLSRIPNLIIYNSTAGCAYHQAQGYSTANSVVVHNGIDVDRFRPSPEVRAAVRGAWAKQDDAILIGLVGRLDPMKDHQTFLKAAQLLRDDNARTEFVCVGSGPVDYKTELMQLATNLGLSDHLRWLEESHDMVSVYNALDIVTLSSYGEGFPNSIAEAMACGVPCVATDAGDCAELIGDTGEMVEVRNPESLMRGWQRMIARMDKDSHGLAQAARTRIFTRFSNARMVAETCADYRRVLELAH